MSPLRGSKYFLRFHFSGLNPELLTYRLYEAYLHKSNLANHSPFTIHHSPFTIHYFKLSYTICKTSLQMSILSDGTFSNASFNVSSAIAIVSSCSFCASFVRYIKLMRLSFSEATLFTRFNFSRLSTKRVMLGLSRNVALHISC